MSKRDEASSTPDAPKPPEKTSGPRPAKPHHQKPESTVKRNKVADEAPHDGNVDPDTDGHLEKKSNH